MGQEHVETFRSSFKAIWGIVFDYSNNKKEHMKKIFLYLFLLLVLFSSCNSKSAFNYSQEVVKTEKLLLPQVEETEKKVAEFFPAQQFDSMAIVSRKMEVAVQNAKDHLDNLPVPDAKQAKEFKEGVMRYFSFMKSVYTDYRKVAEAKTEEERNKHLARVQLIPTKRQEELSRIKEIQQKYADANGFRVQ
jgi:nitrogen fixation/metabolism regulation signal transduction histidine kinase